MPTIATDIPIISDYSSSEPFNISDAPAVLETHLLTRADDGSGKGSIGGGAIAGIIFGVVAGLILLALLIYLARRNPSPRGQIMSPNSGKLYPLPPLQTAHVPLPRYTPPTQPAFAHLSRGQGQPAVYPIQPSGAYYTHSPPPRGVRFGEVGVRRIT